MKEYRMTQQEFEEILKINREQYPVIYGSVGIEMTPTKQEVINSFWRKMGEKYSFDWKTVAPNGSDVLNFKAMPK